MNNITLIKLNSYSHVSQDGIIAFENELVRTLNWETKGELPSLFARIFSKMYRHFSSLFHLLSVIKSKKSYFAIILDIRAVGTKFPFFAFNANKKILYLSDCWEPQFFETEKTLKNLKIDIVFFDSKLCWEYFQEKWPMIKSFWVPSGIVPDEYYAMPYSQKDIDILHLGRRCDAYHIKIVNFCVENNLKYLYEVERGRIIFPKRSDFLKGLARSKISICVPSSVTNPERSGYISVLSLRYFESMLSKCLIVGVMPEEMKYIFDYCPIVEIDMKNPTQQIMYLLKNFDRHIPLIERNYLEVKEKHQWKHRAHDINKIIEREI